MSRYYSIACQEYADSGIKGRITSEINNKVSSELQNDGIQAKQYVNVEYGDNGKIASINVNSFELNDLALSISNTVYESINNIDNSFEFPIGNAMGSEFLSGKGPNVHVTVIPFGAVEYEIGSELSSAGINQTVYRLTITYKTRISCIAPFCDIKTEITTRLIVCEILIVGAVPEFALPFIE